MTTQTETYSTNDRWEGRTFAGCLVKRYFDDKPRIEILFGGEIAHVMYAPGMEYQYALKAFNDRNEEWFTDTLETLSVLT